MSKFFIDRPIFAWVISLLIVLVGIMAISQLPVAQYPSVAPPSISINASYAGASAEVLQNTVTSIIEQQINGLENMRERMKQVGGQFEIRPGPAGGTGVVLRLRGALPPAA